tara:strand:+ start:135 stop:647 length:513 start_codon:yes stop_codon:yes gene_type:complete
MTFTCEELNHVMVLDGVDYKLIPFHYTHLNMMEFRESEYSLINSFIDYEEKIKTCPVEGLSFSGVCFGDIVCCFGIIPLWQGVYEAWLLPCKDLTKNKLRFHKSSLKFFEYVADRLNIHRLQINVNRQNCLAYKWAKKCYFTEEGLLREYGPDKSDFYIMSRLFNYNEKE